jgi:hypothetical protein
MCTSLSKSFYYNRSEWASAPTTLTRLNDICNALPGLLPPTITHLQLLYLDGNNIKQAAEALPGLIRLDFVAYEWDHRTLEHVSKLASLQTLSICIYDADCEPWKQMLSNLSQVKMAIERGMKFNVVTYQDILGVFRGPELKSAWASYLSSAAEDQRSHERTKEKRSDPVGSSQQTQLHTITPVVIMTCTSS